ncbi:MAG: 4-hydroxythreonine-4-phosphate dehydrogenase PdxA [Flavobacteriaceae bacterium]
MEESRERKIKLGISIGDPNGVGIELILKVFQDKRMFDFFTPIVFANTKLLSAQRKHFDLQTSFSPHELGKKLSKNQLNIVEVFKAAFETTFGEATDEAGKIAFASLKAATKALKDGQIDVLVTAPINKKNIQSEEFNFPGHTDYLAKILEGESLMFMVSEKLRVGLLTDHIPVSEVAAAITPALIKQKVAKMKAALTVDFGIAKPKIALLGINPHTGDNGVIGKEDDKILRPTQKEIYAEGTLLFGPYAADSFFGTDLPNQFDAVLATYHDQGLIPFKTLTFGRGVNFTAGLNKVRTSPDHGTAYDIAGKGTVNTASFEEALFTAREIYFNREAHETYSKQEE